MHTIIKKCIIDNVVNNSYIFNIKIVCLTDTTNILLCNYTTILNEYPVIVFHNRIKEIKIVQSVQQFSLLTAYAFQLNLIFRLAYFFLLKQIKCRIQF